MQKLCDGPAVKLPPIKFTAMQRSLTSESAFTNATFTPRSEQAATPSYVPPSMRGAANSTSATPKSISVSDMNSEQSFPTLGAKPSGAATPGSWTHLRAKFATPTTATPKVTETKGITKEPNQYAALDEDATPSIPSTPATSMSFKAAIKQNMKTEEEETIEGVHHIPVSTNMHVDDMTPEELVANGWTILPIKKMAYEAGKYVNEMIDKEDEYFKTPEKYDRMDSVRDAMNNFSTSQGYLESVCRKGMAGEDPWVVHEILVDEEAPVPVRPELPSDSPFLELLRRKKETLKKNKLMMETVAMNTAVSF